jgi:hypothetical protein
VGIDDERVHARVNQVIEREGDEWFLKNWHERFRQRVRKRTQTGSHSRS